VTLLDRSLDDANAAFDRAKKARPPHFFLSETADKIAIGSIEDGSDAIREADWVCEAIFENLNAKQGLFSLIEPLLKPDAMISTNTSGLEIALLSEGRSPSFCRRFLGTHFFNPPRYLKLLELIPTPLTDPKIVEELTQFLEERAARRVVLAKDTPGFIANRYGMWCMYKAVHTAEKLGLTVEQTDLITGPYLGRPKSGSFRLNDLVGIDVMDAIATNLIDRCEHDPHTNILRSPNSIEFLKEKGWLGSKSRQGYYRKEGRELVALDLYTQAYREMQRPEITSITEYGRLPFPERLQKGLNAIDEAGEFLRHYLVPSLQYANAIKEEVSHNVQDFDRVMQWGFGWQAGPFEMIDIIGAEKLGISGGRFYEGAKIRGFDGEQFKPNPEPGFATVHDFPVVDEGEGYRLRDFGDGISGLCLTHQMGVWSPETVRSVGELLSSGRIGRMVLTSEGRAYGAGYDLKHLLACIESEDFEQIDASLREFQELGMLIGTIPSVAAVFGFCLGGGFEMAASCSMIAASAESQIGLPEMLVGVVPGGGGTGIMRLRNQSDAKSLVNAITLIAAGHTAKNADEARELGFLRRADKTIYHPDRVLTEAISLARDVIVSPRPVWAEVAGPAVGMADRELEQKNKRGELSEYDLQIGDLVKPILGRASSFEHACEMERAAFIQLCQDGLTQARMKHMVETNKPLRN
jgi:3-hydroxyacyl-CoA dehydrogenase